MKHLSPPLVTARTRTHFQSMTDPNPSPPREVPETEIESGASHPQMGVPGGEPCLEISNRKRKIEEKDYSEQGPTPKSPKIDKFNPIVTVNGSILDIPWNDAKNQDIKFKDIGVCVRLGRNEFGERTMDITNEGWKFIDSMSVTGLSHPLQLFVYGEESSFRNVPPKNNPHRYGDGNIYVHERVKDTLKPFGNDYYVFDGTSEGLLTLMMVMAASTNKQIRETLRMQERSVSR